jgi:mannosyltransferase
MSKRTSLLILLVIICAGVALRSYLLTARSLWFDEAFSWRLIQFPVAELLARDATDVHPPLYYLVLKGWSVVFGTSLLSLRSFSVTAAGGAIAAAYLFGSSATRSRATGLLAAALLALSGWQIQFAWEARMYTLGTMLALLSAWALLRALRAEPQRLGWWFLYAALGLAFAYIHYYAFFTLAAEIIFIIGYLAHTSGGRIVEIFHDRRLWHAVLATLLMVGGFAPWLPTFLQQNDQVQLSYWVPAIGGWSIPDTFYRMFIPTAAIPQHMGIGWIVLASLPILGTGALLFLLVKRFSRHASTPDANWLVLLLVAVPFVLSISISLVSQSLYQDRFFVFAHLFILAALAMVTMRLPWRPLRMAAVAVLLLGFFGADLQFWQELAIPAKPGVRGATTRLMAEHQMGEPIVVSSPFIYFAVLHYAEADEQNPELPRLYSETGMLQHFAGGPILTMEDVVGPAVFAADSSVLWAVDTTGFGGTPLPVPAPWRPVMTETYSEVFSHQGTVSVTKYVK